MVLALFLCLCLSLSLSQFSSLYNPAISIHMTRFVVKWKYYDLNIGAPMLNCEQII